MERKQSPDAQNRVLGLGVGDSGSSILLAPFPILQSVQILTIDEPIA